MEKLKKNNQKQKNDKMKKMLKKGVHAKKKKDMRPLEHTRSRRFDLFQSEESKELLFDVRPKGSGKTTASLAARRTKEKVSDALVTNVEAWTVAVSHGAQETPVMLEAVLLAASTSESDVECQVRAWPKLPQATHVPTATPILTSKSVSPASLVFLSGRLAHVTRTPQPTAKVQRSTRRCTVERHLLSDRTDHLCPARVRNSSLSSLFAHKCWSKMEDQYGKHCGHVWSLSIPRLATMADPEKEILRSKS